MKRLHVDPFWVGMGCAAGCLVLLWSLGLAPRIVRQSRLRGEIASRARALEQAKEATPSRADIESWNKYKAEILQSKLRITNFYVENSRTFHSWFAELPKAPDGDPAREGFVARYRDEAAKLEDQLTRGPQPVVLGDIDGDRAPGFHWEDLGIDRWGAIGREDERSVLRELQKRYWARRRVADLALGGRVRVSRIVDFRFARPLHEKFPEGGALLRGPLLPEDPLQMFTFSFAVELPYSDVARAIHEVVAPGAGAGAREGMLLHVIDAQVTICSQNPPEAKETEILKGVKPGKVRLTLTCRILDFAPGG